jgi:hypothetical protein
MKEELIKRNYLGEGYVHFFVNDETGEEAIVECTQEDYDALALPNAVNPTLKGHTWLQSHGKTIKVDTPTTILSKGEYCEFDGGAYVVPKDGKPGKVELAELVNTFSIAEDYGNSI